MVDPTPPQAEPAPTATEVVTRPDPGLARGKWEAPTWFFWAAIAVVVLGAVGYFLRRTGMLKLKRDAADTPPPSSKVRRP